jgi:hypothetical protein
MKILDLAARSSPPRNLVASWLGRPTVKRTQRGIFTTVGGGSSQTVTGFSAVDPLNTLIYVVALGGQAAVDSSGHPWAARLFLSSDGTTLSLDSTTNLIVSWEAREYVPGIWRSIQRGTITANATSVNATLGTRVDTNRAMLNSMGVSGFTGTDDTHVPYLTLTDGVTITAVTNTGGAAVIGWQIADPF